MTGALGLASLALIGCRRSDADAGYALALGETGASPDIPSPRPTPTLDETLGHIRLARAAEVRTLISVRYDPAYVSLDYPGGDVPDNTGVCADVIIRAYRALDTDLQVAIHEDMRANFQAYPTFWGLTRPDRNIDHRRVLNLETYFNRCGDALAVVSSPPPALFSLQPCCATMAAATLCMAWFTGENQMIHSLF